MNDFKQLIESAKEQYNKLIIINDEKTDSHDPSKYKKYCKEHKIEIFDLSVELAKLLTKVPVKDRDQEAVDKLKEWMLNLNLEVIAFENIDYIFSEELGQIDIIKTLNYYTRKTRLVILFIKAKRKNNLLVYSEEGNPDYIELDISNNEGFVIGW